MGSILYAGFVVHIYVQPRSHFSGALRAHTVAFVGSGVKGPVPFV